MARMQSAQRKKARKIEKVVTPAQDFFLLKINFIPWPLTTKAIIEINCLVDLKYSFSFGEVHPEHATEERERDEYGGDDRQHLHHLVHLVAHHVHVDVENGGDGITIGLEHVRDVDAMVVDITQVQGRVVTDDRLGFGLQRLQ